MKKLFWMMLAALPLQAMASADDPIAYKCYYCTPAEMEDVALAQGVGRHYVYDYSDLKIIGYDVEHWGSGLLARPFVAEKWVQEQFVGFLNLYDPATGASQITLENVSLLAPGTEHGRSSRLLWGHHLSALNPVHDSARETVHRYLMAHEQLRFLDTASSGGKLLRFAHTIGNPAPITATMSLPRRQWGTSLSWAFSFDHDARRWRFVWAFDGTHSIQHARHQFAPPYSSGHYRYSQWDRDLAEAFVERAQWASIPVGGQIPYGRDTMISCRGSAEDVSCALE